MAFLTVVAAFMFQVRIDALGGLAQHEMPAAQSQLDMSQMDMSHMDMSGGHGHSHEHGHGQSAHSPDASLPPSAPTFPTPATHDHAAHCPFCLSNAFALEAGVVGLPQGPPQYAPKPFVHVILFVAAFVPHADARAPPVTPLIGLPA